MKQIADLIPPDILTEPIVICTDVLDYLKERIPGYPYNPKIDDDFVDELINDFADIDIIEQLKAFRWYYDNKPVAKVSNVRLSIRRWLANAKKHDHY